MNIGRVTASRRGQRKGFEMKEKKLAVIHPASPYFTWEIGVSDVISTNKFNDTKENRALKRKKRKQHAMGGLY